MSDCVQPGRLDNDIVDDAASDEEVGCEDECKDGPGGGGLNAFTTYFTFLWKAYYAIHIKQYIHEARLVV